MGSEGVSWPESPHGDHARWLWETIQARGAGVSAGDVDAHCTGAATEIRTGIAQGFEGDRRFGASVSSVRVEDEQVVIRYRSAAGLRVDEVITFDPGSGRIEWSLPRLEHGASTTALMTATMRGAHTRYDTPRIHDDPLAEALAGDLYASDRNRVRDGGPDATGYDVRWILAARARLAEDTAADAYRDGVRQYVVLGAGLDSFAYRNPHDDLLVFEVDGPASQAWKRQRLADCGIAVPPTARHVACDFETDHFTDRLVEAGFRPAEPAVVAWLGVIYYLTADAIDSTLASIARWAAGTRLVFDYRLPQSRWDDFPGWDPGFLRAAVAAITGSGEGTPSGYDHDEIPALLTRHGYTDIETFDHDDVRRIYMNGQTSPTPGPTPVTGLARATVA